MESQFCQHSRFPLGFKKGFGIRRRQGLTLGRFYSWKMLARGLGVDWCDDCLKQWFRHGYSVLDVYDLAASEKRVKNATVEGV